MDREAVLIEELIKATKKRKIKWEMTFSTKDNLNFKADLGPGLTIYLHHGTIDSHISFQTSLTYWTINKQEVKRLADLILKLRETKKTEMSPDRIKDLERVTSYVRELP